jgi:phage terminase Nu1 subunit (DNA packaging protein)
MSHASEGDGRKILNSWKEIARYLDRGVRTVQRWEDLGLPVRRLNQRGRGAVFAFRSELDSWLRQCSAVVASNEGFLNGDPTRFNREISSRIVSRRSGRTAQLILQAEEMRVEMSRRREHVYEAISELQKRISSMSGSAQKENPSSTAASVFFNRRAITSVKQSSRA